MNANAIVLKGSLVILLGMILLSNVGCALCKKVEVGEVQCPVMQKTYYPRNARECFEKPCIIRTYPIEGRKENGREE